MKEWYKGFLEDCPNGELSKEHLVEIYSQIFPGGNSEKFAEHVFGTFDTDRSGTIDFREFMLALHVTSCGTPEEKIRWAFRMYDIDGNGMIDITELKRLVQEFPCQVSETEKVASNKGLKPNLMQRSIHRTKGLNQNMHSTLFYALGKVSF